MRFPWGFDDRILNPDRGVSISAESYRDSETERDSVSRSKVDGRVALRISMPPGVAMLLRVTDPRSGLAQSYPNGIFSLNPGLQFRAGPARSDYAGLRDSIRLGFLTLFTMDVFEILFSRTNRNE
jgi:hypothetical protein